MTDPLEAALVETQPEAPVIEAFDNTYELRRKPPSMPILRFSKLASKGVRTDSMEAGAAMYDLLRYLFTEESWPRFEEDSTEAGMDNDDLLGIVGRALEAINGFPTTSSSASAPGLQTSTPSSTGSSFEDLKRELGMTPVTPESLAELVH